MKNIFKLLKSNILVVSIVIILVIVASVIGTYALTGNTTDSNADISYTFTIGNTNPKELVVNSKESKLIEIKVKNTNPKTIKYGLIYNNITNENITITQADYSQDNVEDIIDSNTVKTVSIEIVNNSDTNQTFSFDIITGYENGGDLIIPTGYQLVSGSKLTDKTGTNNINIESTKDTLKDYRIYGNSIQDGTPTEEKPIAISDVGDKTNNLLVQDYMFKTKSINNITLEVQSDKSFLIKEFNGGSAANFSLMGTFHDITSPTLFTLKAGTYILSKGTSNVYCQIALSSGMNEIVLVNLLKRTIEFTLTEDTNITYANIWFSGDSKYFATTGQVIQPMLYEKGTTINDYEAYGYKIPIEAIDNNNIKKTNIYVSDPLRKVGNNADYIDFKSKKLVRFIGVINSYNGEDVGSEYLSTTGALSAGATVYYVLSNPIVTDIDLPEIAVINGKNTIGINSSVSPSKFIIKYYGL